MDLNSLWSIILSLVSESGVWAMLFLALLIVLIKSNNAREEKYQTIIEKLGNSLKKVEEIKEDVEDLKYIAGIGGNSDKLASTKISKTNLNKQTQLNISSAVKTKTEITAGNLQNSTTKTLNEQASKEKSNDS